MGRISTGANPGRTESGTVAQKTGAPGAGGASEPGAAASGAEKPAATFEDFSSGDEWLELPIDIKLKVLKLLTVERDTPDDPAPCSRKR